MQAANQIDILIVEDNPADIFLLKKMLNSSSLQINTLFTTDKVQEAQEALKTQHFHITLLDLSLPDSIGIDTFLGIKASVKKIPVIILTGLNDAGIALEALKQGAQDYLVKGKFNGDLLTRAIQYSLERKKAEEALLVSEEKYKQMFYQNFFPSWIYDPATLKILEVNDAAIRTYGYDREEFLKLTLKDIRPMEDIPLLMKTMGSHHDKSQVKLWRHKKKNGEIMNVEVTFFPINYFGRIVSQAQIHDVTEEVKLQKQLKEQQQAEQKNITAAVLKALESDRAHLGEELHDNINQILATSMLYLEHAKSHVEVREEMIGRSLEVISLVIEEIRKLSRKLIVSDIMDIGLKKTIEEMIAGIMLVKKMEIVLNMENFPEKKLEENLKIAVYRIIQEQLTNILKHAAASSVLIELHKEEKQIILEINDNGKGFDPTLHRKGVGITNITSRASLFDGEVIIDSAPGKGCNLKVTLHTIK
jgi:two-component system sensor histidine kinase UhpB